MSNEDSETNSFLNTLGNYLITDWQEKELRKRLAEFGSIYEIDDAKKNPRFATIIRKHKNVIVRLEIKMTREKIEVPKEDQKESPGPTQTPTPTHEIGEVVEGSGIGISGTIAISGNSGNQPDFSFGTAELDSPD